MMLTSFLRAAKTSVRTIRRAERHLAAQEELAELCVGREDRATDSPGRFQALAQPAV
jgi:hypothetical protein